MCIRDRYIYTTESGNTRIILLFILLPNWSLLFRTDWYPVLRLLINASTHPHQQCTNHSVRNFKRRSCAHIYILVPSRRVLTFPDRVARPWWEFPTIAASFLELLNHCSNFARLQNAERRTQARDFFLVKCVAACHHPHP